MLRTGSAELHQVEESEKRAHNTEWERKRSPCTTESPPIEGAFNLSRSWPGTDHNLLYNSARNQAGLFTSPASSSQKAAVARFMQSNGSPSSLGWCRLSPKNIKALRSWWEGQNLAEKVRNKKGRRVLEPAPCSASAAGAFRSAVGRRRLCCTCTCSRARWEWPAGGTGRRPAGAGRSRQKSPPPEKQGGKKTCYSKPRLQLCR